jgi:uncharacterized membrane protein YbaN (DUF454 family)
MRCVDVEGRGLAERGSALSIYLWRAAGLAAFIVGTIGIFLPLLPTVVFYILAAFCFGKSNPEWEARLLRHPLFGPHIVAWRERRAIARRGKIAAVIMLAGSAILGLLVVPGAWRYAPLVAATLVGGWILSLRDA